MTAVGILTRHLARWIWKVDEKSRLEVIRVNIPGSGGSWLQYGWCLVDDGVVAGGRGSGVVGGGWWWW